MRFPRWFFISALWPSLLLGPAAAFAHLSHGLGDGSALKAANLTKAVFIQGLPQQAGINLGRQEFFATSRARRACPSNRSHELAL